MFCLCAVNASVLTFLFLLVRFLDFCRFLFCSASVQDPPPPKKETKKEKKEEKKEEPKKDK